MLVYVCGACGKFGLLSDVTADDAWKPSLFRCLSCGNEDIDWIERKDLGDAKDFDVEPDSIEKVIRMIELRSLQLVTVAQYVNDFEKLSEMLKRLRSCFTV